MAHTTHTQTQLRDWIGPMGRFSENLQQPYLIFSETCLKYSDAEYLGMLTLASWNYQWTISPMSCSQALLTV